MVSNSSSWSKISSKVSSVSCSEADLGCVVASGETAVSVSFGVEATLGETVICVGSIVLVVVTVAVCLPQLCSKRQQKRGAKKNANLHEFFKSSPPDLNKQYYNLFCIM